MLTPTEVGSNLPVLEEYKAWLAKDAWDDWKTKLLPPRYKFSILTINASISSINGNVGLTSQLSCQRHMFKLMH
jgi:hypothetical protein